MKKLNPQFLLLLFCLDPLLSCTHQKTLTAGPTLEKSQKLQVDESPNTLIAKTKQLTFAGSKSGEGYFSPDGKKMIFQSEREPGNPFYQMYLMDLASGETQRLSPGFGKTTCGWIHPSMKKVLFSSTHLDAQWKQKSDEEIETRKHPVKGRYAWSFDENYDIFSSDLNGKNLRRLTHEKGYDAEGSYSPDGNWIVFASNRAGYTEKLSEEDEKYFKQDPSYMMDIYIMKADGTGVKRLTTTKGYDGGPFFSADGKKITWRRFAPNGMTAEIYTMNLDGSDQQELTHLKSMSWAPFFHPSGDYLIFTSSVYGFSNFELFIVDALGKHRPVRVTFNDDFDGLPVFTPDGNKLSWTRRNAKGDSQIMMADWDDVQARQLLHLPPREPDAKNLDAALRVSDVKTWIHYLASDQFIGRSTGGPAEKIYTEKIAQILKAWGFVGLGPQGSFFDKFDYTSGVQLGKANTLEMVGSLTRKYQVSQDFEPVSFSQVGSFREAPVVFVGYGLKAPASDHGPAYDSYKDIDVHGKWVLILNDIPQGLAPARRQELNNYARLQHKLTVAKNAGAVGILFTNGPATGLAEKLGKLKYEGALSESPLAVLKLTTAAAVELVKQAGQDLAGLQAKLDQGQEQTAFVIPSSYIKAQVDLVFEHAQGLNVVAQFPVPGAKTSVLLGAHGDHLGHGELGNSLAKKDEKDFIHFGADDNASGVAGVMELAQAFAEKSRTSPHELKKNLIVAIWSGEEIGVLGSSHWVSRYEKQTGHKITKDIVAALNMDMIGRFENQLYVQGVGSAQNWPRLAEEIGLRTGMPLTLQDDPYLPTDSISFYLAGIPSISFFTGSHAEYHSPRDRAELIHFEGEVRVLQAVQGFLQLLTDSSQNLVQYVKVAGDTSKRMEGRSFRVYVGTIPDYSQQGVQGVKISGVSKESPAEKAGLREKDVIVEFDGTKVENLYDYVYVLQSVKPNQETSLAVLREGKRLNLKVTPTLKE